MARAERLRLVVADARSAARDVRWLELRSTDGKALPPFSPGSHLEIDVAPGVIRHYSICNDPCETDRYCIGVGLARDSRGGSKFMHQQVRVGDVLACSAPRNNFPLDLAAAGFVFVAGGIGITPILSMLTACQNERKPWMLLYAARSRPRAAFYEELSSAYAGQCRFHFDDEQGGALDVEAALKEVSEHAQIYCCGPEPLMKAVEHATRHRPPDSVRFEWFSAPADAAADVVNRPFSVVLHSSGQRFDVPADQSILGVLEANGCGVPFSCREGLCATCRTGVVRGVPDHRDQVLSATERAANDQMLICVSRAQSDEIELDL